MTGIERGIERTGRGTGREPEEDDVTRNFNFNVICVCFSTLHVKELMNGQHGQNGRQTGTSLLCPFRKNDDTQ